MVDDIRKVQAEIANGEWAANVQANAWAGHAICRVLAIDTTADEGPGKNKAKALLAAWIKSGALKTEMRRDDAKGRERLLCWPARR